MWGSIPQPVTFTVTFYLGTPLQLIYPKPKKYKSPVHYVDMPHYSMFAWLTPTFTIKKQLFCDMILIFDLRLSSMQFERYKVIAGRRLYFIIYEDETPSILDNFIIDIFILTFFCIIVTYKKG